MAMRLLRWWQIGRSKMPLRLVAKLISACAAARIFSMISLKEAISSCWTTFPRRLRARQPLARGALRFVRVVGSRHGVVARFIWSQTVGRFGGTIDSAQAVGP